MDTSTRTSKILAFVVVSVVTLLCLGALLLISTSSRSLRSEREKVLADEKAKLEKIMELVNGRPEWEAKQAEYVRELQRYYLTIPEGAVPPNDGFTYVPEADYDAVFYENIQTLAKYTGATFDSWRPSEYNPRQVEKDPTVGKTGEELEKAKAALDKDPALKRRVELGKKYEASLKRTQSVANIRVLELKIRGRLENIQLFVVGLCGFPIPTGTSPSDEPWYMPQIALVTNMNVRVLGDEKIQEKLNVGEEDPILECVLDCRYFPLKPFSAPKVTVSGETAGSGQDSPNKENTETTAS